MKISEFAVDKQVDELTAGEVGAAAGKATRAVGSGIKNFAKGFASGISSKVTPANPQLKSIKSSIAALNPKQQAALRKQLAKKAGVA